MMLSMMVIFILFILGHVRDSCGQKPLIRPNTREVLINAGDTIEFKCIDSKKIFFFFPEYQKENGQKTVSVQPESSESETNGEHIYKFSRHNAAPTDTGWYGCSNHDVTVIPEANCFSNDTGWYDCTGRDLTIVVKPNSSVVDRKNYSIFENYKKTVISEIYNESEVNWIYFYVTSPNSSFVEEDEMRTITGIENYTAIVPCRPTSPDLEVVLHNEDKGEVVQIGENISYDPKLGFKFSKCTEEDTGHFTCNMTKNGVEYKTSYHLQVRRPNYMILNPLNIKLYNGTLPSEKEAVFTATVYAFPEAKLKWFSPWDDLITPGLPIYRNLASKYDVKMTPSLTTLTIYEPDIENVGTYKLQATNNKFQIFINFTLEISVEPRVLLESDESYHPLGQFAEIVCHVDAFPPPKITLTFLRCPYYPSKENSSLVELTSRIEKVKVGSFISKTNMTTDVSGIVNCTACNSEGCNSNDDVFLVTEEQNILNILKPKRTIVEGDSISIVCVASIYEFTDNITWTKGLKDVPIEESERINIVKQKTPFSYHSILNIRDVRKEDEDVYTCSAQDNYKLVFPTKYYVSVYDQIPPIFTNSSLMGKNINIDIGTERYKTTILMCYVLGLPKPNVTWYKDGIMLEKNKQYSFFHEDQELSINFLEEGSGNYSCRATNRLDTIEDFVNITIKGNGPPDGLISSIVILLIIFLILMVSFIINTRRKKIFNEFLEVGLLNFEEGIVENLNLDLSVNDQAELLPYDKKWEFPKEQLKLGKHLGSGAFGVVMKAEAVGICKDEKITTVAVKMVRPTSDLTYIRALASELKIMVHLGKHLNVVNLLGACTKNILKRELFVIVEYCPFGNLHSYLLRHRAGFINQIDPATGKLDPTIGSDQLKRTTNVNSNENCINTNSDVETADSMTVTMSTDSCILNNNSSLPERLSNYCNDYKDQNLKPICSQDLLSWAFQVARGMEYLSQRKVLHGDLAARNVLLTENNVVKICDFGLAKTMYKDDNYKKKGDEPLPVKWMAIESIRDRVFSIQSDIWSFGIVLWEFFTLAETPYHGMAFEELYQKLKDGYRLQQPVYATSDVYKIMLLCWNAEPTLRPRFTELVDCIGDLLEGSVKALYISLNIPYMDMNAETLAGKIDYLTMQSSPDYTTSLSSSPEFVQRQDIKEEVEIDANNDRDSV